jgi:hypothetical protein
MTAQSDAANIYTTAQYDARASYAVNFKTLEGTPAVDTLTYANPPEFATTLDTVTVPNYSAEINTNQRSDMKTFVAGGLTDWITTYAPKYHEIRTNLEVKVYDAMKPGGGGTALKDTVELTMFNRSRARIDKENAATKALVARNLDRRGFPLPAGVLAAGERLVDLENAQRIAASATDITLKRYDVELDYVKLCMDLSKTLYQGVDTSLLAYAGIVATVNEASLNYANAVVQAMDAKVKADLAVASAKFDAGDTSFKNDIVSLQTGIEALAKKLELQLQKATLVLDQAKAQTSADVQLEQVEAQLHMNKINALVSSANAGASVQASIASSAVSTGNTLVQQTEE